MHAKLAAAALVLTLAPALFIAPAGAQRTPDLSLIELPAGFTIDYFATDVPNARSMARGDAGTIFVGTRQSQVYAVIDEDGDQRADRVLGVARDLWQPNGMAFREGALYVAEINRVLRYDDIESHLDSEASIPEPAVVIDTLPRETWHGWKYLRFGPDDLLYTQVGAPCNICLSEDPIFASIIRMKPDGSGLEIFAHGVRNTVGFDWHPVTGVLWFTDNGRDWLGDNQPPDELNRAPEPGLHFGFPYVHGEDKRDPEFWDRKPEDLEIVRPVQELGPHVAALGIRFYTGDQFPAEYRHQAFIAEHGSWNRSEKIGYRVMLVRLDENREATSYEPFATGWLQPGERVIGRPVDLHVMPDGAMLVSDDHAGVIYRISYTAPAE